MSSQQEVTTPKNEESNHQAQEIQNSASEVAPQQSPPVQDDHIQVNEEVENEEIHQQAAEEANNHNHAEEKNNSSEDDTLFNQFLNELFEEYQSADEIYKAIDQNGKGFFEQEDLARELVSKFGIEDKRKQEEIFLKLSSGEKQVSKSKFQEITKRQEERKQKEEENNQQLDNNLQPTNKSPFKDKKQRKKILDILESDKKAENEADSKVDYVQEDNKYATVIRQLRQQHNFDDFVRSYNSFQFHPNNSQGSIFSSQDSWQQEYHPFSQITPSNHTVLGNRFEIFSNPAPFVPAGSFMNTSPVRKAKPSLLNFSPSIFNSTESPSKGSQQRQQIQNQRDVKFPKSNLFHQKQTSLGGRYLSPPSFQKLKSQPNNVSGQLSKLFLNPRSKPSLSNIHSGIEHDRKLSNIFNLDTTSTRLSKSNIFSPKQSNSNFFKSKELNYSPNQAKKNRLRRQVGLGVDNSSSSSSAYMNRSPGSPKNLNNKGSNNSVQLLMKNQFKQYLAHMGMVHQSPPKSVKMGKPRHIEQEDTFGDILYRIQSGRIVNSSLEKIRKVVPDLETIGGAKNEKNPFLNGPFRPSQSPHGTNGQIKRVKQIQASLTAACRKINSKISKQEVPSLQNANERKREQKQATGIYKQSLTSRVK